MTHKSAWECYHLSPRLERARSRNIFLSLSLSLSLVPAIKRKAESTQSIFKNLPHDSPPTATPPLVSGSSGIYSTASRPSITQITQRTRDALARFYTSTYGDNSNLCLVTLNSFVEVAHIVRRASSSSEAR